MIMSSKYIFTLTQSWLPSTSLSLPHHGLYVYLWVQLISVSKFISNYGESRPSSGSLSLYNNRLQVYLCVHWIVMFTSATTLVCFWNTRVFQAALTALTEPRTLWQKMTCCPSTRRRLTLRTYLHFFAPAICIIRTTRVLHSLQGLQLCCSRLHKAWRCLFLSSANSHILPLHYCYILDAALAPYMFSFDILSHDAIESSLRIHRLPLHLLRHYRISLVRNIQSIFHTLQYDALSHPHSALIPHRLAMVIPPHRHPQCRHTRTHTRRHHWFPGQTYYALSPPHCALNHHWLGMLLPHDPHTCRRHPRPHTRRHHWFPGQTSRVQSQVVGIASRTSLASPSSLKSPLPPGIPKWCSSSVLLLSIRMFGSVLPISGSSSATSKAKWSRRIALSTQASSTLITTAGIGFSACWIWPLTVARGQ